LTGVTVGGTGHHAKPTTFCLLSRYNDQYAHATHNARASTTSTLARARKNENENDEDEDEAETHWTWVR
jgi:quinol monooxygenase YgiN